MRDAPRPDATPTRDEIDDTIQADSQDRRRRMVACIEHCRDILREHGYGKRWQSVPTPAEPVYRARISNIPHSACGSPADMCAAEGDL